MKLIAYLPDGHDIDIRPAPSERAWMDETSQRFAYRCLPLTIANAHGWEVLCASGFTAEWNGENDLDAITVTPAGAGPAPAISHFGHGVLTFHVTALFRTDPGYDLMVQGPVNRPKDAIAPLTGIVETDWAPYAFTMNWRFTQPEIEVTFEKGEPYCTIFPVRHAEVEAVEPSILPLSSDPELEAQFTAWRASRSRFNEELPVQGSEAHDRKWQKAYHRGLNPDGGPAATDAHRTRLKLRPFRRVDTE